MPLLQKYWPALNLPPDAHVLVPLAGKSMDVAWLAQQGHNVLAVELSPLAVTQFFKAHQLQPETRATAHGTLYSAPYGSGRIEFLCADVFTLEPDQLQPIQACYDRAALIALPPDMRRRYARHVYGRLPAGTRTLLLTLDYPQPEMEGPPFSVPETEVRTLFGSHWDIALLDERDILEKEPKFAARGLSRLRTGVYRLTAQA